MTLTHQDIAAAHYRICQRRNIQPPPLLTRLYPTLKTKASKPHRPGQIPVDVVRAIYLAAWQSELTQDEIARQHGVNLKAVSHIKRRYRYAEVTADLWRDGVR